MFLLLFFFNIFVSKKWKISEKIDETEFLRCENKNECLDDESIGEELKIVKPDITFFGEELPRQFLDNYMNDLRSCDLLIIMVIHWTCCCK